MILSNDRLDYALPHELVERILAKLGIQKRHGDSFEDLQAIYSAWCQMVPFDNVRKMIHRRTANPGPLPGHSADDFFHAWLMHGTGGTCWAGAGALHALLRAVGFNASRGLGTMLAAPDLPPNHGTVCVTIDDKRYLVDTAMLTGEPLLLDETLDTSILHRSRGLQCTRKEGRWHINWRPLHKTDGFECRLERFGLEEADYQHMHESTREWSPFNYQLSIRLNRGEQVVGVAFGSAITLHEDGSVISTAITTEERNQLLIERLNLSEDIVAELPADVPTPPPPGSRTALAQQ